MRKLAMVAALVALCFIVAPTMADDGVCDGDGPDGADHDGDGLQTGNPGNGNSDGSQDGTGEGSPWADS